eukprot:scaffold2847_cov144-Alexandrium_tamarense.AAC.2
MVGLYCSKSDGARRVAHRKPTTWRTRLVLPRFGRDVQYWPNRQTWHYLLVQHRCKMCACRSKLDVHPISAGAKDLASGRAAKVIQDSFSLFTVCMTVIVLFQFCYFNSDRSKFSAPLRSHITSLQHYRY